MKADEKIYKRFIKGDNKCLEILVEKYAAAYAMIDFATEATS